MEIGGNLRHLSCRRELLSTIAIIGKEGGRSEQEEHSCCPVTALEAEPRELTPTTAGRLVDMLGNLGS